MTLDQWTAIFQPHIETELHAIVDRRISAQTPELHTMLAYHLGWEGEGSGPAAQGKRIRPLMVLLCAGAANPDGDAWKCALPAAAAVELIHNFSLIHDDIQDNSPLRRGRPTVWTQWGIAQAINAGDAMFTLAFSALTRLQETVSTGAALQAHALLEQACLDLTRGQYLDMAYERRSDLRIEDYWPMVEGKTAALLGACAGLGGVAGRACAKELEAFQRFGRNLGLAFQALDDWLGLWGDAAQIGKSTESDLVAGKKTLPVLFGLAQKGAFAHRWNSGPISADEAPEIAGLLAGEGAQEYTQRTADDLNRQALEALEVAAPGSDFRDALVELTARLLLRKS
jgi:geranylgeranyl diphosphate synthase, type I